MSTPSGQTGPVWLRGNWSVGVLLLCLIVFFSSLPLSGRSLYYSDFAFITYPVKSFLAQTFQSGALPFWTPSIDSGTPFMAAFHTGVFYPPSLVFLLPNTTLALNLFYGFHFFILAIPTFYLARSWQLSNPAALGSALTAVLSSFFLSSTMLSNWFLAAVWLPLVFLLFQKFIIEKRTLYFVAATLILMCQVLAASPEVCILTVLLLLPYSLILVPQGNSSFSRYGRITALGVMVILALGLSALQLVPTYYLMEHSVREGGLSFEEHSYRSMALSQMGELLAPNDFDAYFSGNGPPRRITTFFISIYMGVLPLFLLVVGFHFRKNKAVQFWLWVFLIGLFFASGAYNPIYKWIYSWTPLMSLFRFPEKFFTVSAFALVFLTGHVLGLLVQATQKREIKWPAVLLPLLLVSGMAGVVYAAQPGKSILGPLVALLGFGGAYVLFYLGKLRVSSFYAIALLLLVQDLAVQGYTVMPTVDNGFYQTPPQLLPRIQNDENKFRVYTGRLRTQLFKGFPNEPHIEGGYYAAREHLYPYFGMIFGVEYPNGIGGIGLELKQPRVWSEEFGRSPPPQRIRILERSNVKYWIDGDSPTEFSRGRPVILPERLKLLEAALPRAFLVPHWRRAEDSKILATYYDPSFDPRAEVLLSEAVDFEPSPNFNGTVQEVTYRPNHVTVKTVQQGNGFLVLMDSYFPGWTVRVDGEEQPILCANHFYRAVRLDSGPHTLEFDYFPEGFREGLMVSAGAAVILLVLLLWRRRARDPAQGP